MEPKCKGEIFNEIFEEYYEPLCQILFYFTKNSQKTESLINTDIVLTYLREDIEDYKGYLFKLVKDRCLTLTNDKKLVELKFIEHNIW